MKRIRNFTVKNNTHSILVTLFSVQLNTYRNCSSVAFLYTSLDLMFICCGHNRFLHGVDYWWTGSKLY